MPGVSIFIMDTIIATASPMSWDEAICQYNISDVDNKWRLPTIEELLTLVDYDRINPSTELPDIKPTSYWVSNTLVSYTNYGWCVDFHYGYGDYYNKCNSRYIRTVRGGCLNDRV